MKKDQASQTPQNFEWKVKSSREAQEITKTQSPFQKVQALMQTVENPAGIEVYGWICEQSTGHLFIPYDSETPLSSESCWFEQIMPI